MVYIDGSIVFIKFLDREFSSKYSFKVWVYDLGIFLFSSQITVNVLVGDSNDNVLIIVYFSIENNLMLIFYLVFVGFFIVSIKVYDLDEEGLNSQLEYFFNNGNEFDIFYIGKNIGKIFLKKIYYVNMDVIFVVFVIVRDKGDNLRSNIMNFYIVLKYLNGTMVEVFEDNGNKNIVIIVIIVCFIILIFAVIFIIICIFCRQDKKLKKFYQ